VAFGGRPITGTITWQRDSVDVGTGRSVTLVFEAAGSYSLTARYASTRTAKTTVLVAPRPSDRASAVPDGAPSARRRAGRRPVVVVSGGYQAPAGVPARHGCAGRVRLALVAGRRTIATRSVGLSTRCRYDARITARRRVRRALQVKVSFAGNAWLAPAATTLRVRR
jgi:hypothetical protein